MPGGNYPRLLFCNPPSLPPDTHIPTLPHTPPCLVLAALQEIVSQLLSAGANPSVTNSAGSSPLLEACMSGSRDIQVISRATARLYMHKHYQQQGSSRKLARYFHGDTTTPHPDLVGAGGECKAALRAPWGGQLSLIVAAGRLRLATFHQRLKPT